MSSKKRKTGVSRTVQISSGSSSTNSSRIGDNTAVRRTLGFQARLHEHKEAQERMNQQLIGLSQQSLDILSELQGSSTENNIDNEDIIMIDGTEPDRDDWLNLGEALDGDLAMVNAIEDTIPTRYHNVRNYRDQRTWHQRIVRQHENWDPIMEDVTTAYLKWKYNHPTPARPHTPTSWSDPSSTTSAASVSSTGDDTYDFDIDVVDIYDLHTTARIQRSASSTTQTALTSQGWIGSSPVSPTQAVSIRTLDLFHLLRLRKPSLSVEAFTKVICDLYGIPYRRAYRTIISDTYDVYLDILRRVDRQVKAVLGRDTPNWRALNSCPPCGYELEGEPNIIYTRMMAMDGNNTLKCMATTGNKERGDTRVFLDSDYYLKVEEVERYANEVKTRPSRPKATVVEVEDDGDSDDEQHRSIPGVTPGDAADASVPEWDPSIACADNWKAAAANDKKVMWGVFEETGVFVSACRHGFILWMTDMIRSGELAKYPLTISAKALEVFQQRLLLGFDIGCSFLSTLAQSALLGDKWRQSQSRCCVNAFHGSAHNYACQSKNHPNNIEGMGIEDLETLERIFSSSNQLANVTRYASPFRRRVLIDAFFQQWDRDKYENLGTMLFDNQIQASKIIQEKTAIVDETCRVLGIQRLDLGIYRSEEASYFATIGKEPQYDVHAVAYVDLLDELQKLTHTYNRSQATFMNQSSIDFHDPQSTTSSLYQEQLSQTQKAETARRLDLERRNVVLQEVVAMEVKLGIIDRWTPASPEYRRAMEYSNTRKYQRALQNVQRLVVLRLFELQKMNISQTGYKTCSHIGKALQTRCKALRRGVKNYNAAALAMDPPRPTIDWSKVSHYSFVEEFSLMGETDNDIRQKPWASPVVKEAMKADARIIRAHEELERIQIEAKRLHTSIVDEHHQFGPLLSAFQLQPMPIAGAVQEYIIRRKRVNYRLLARLHQLYSLPDYTGDGLPGIRKAEPLLRRECTDQSQDLTPSEPLTQPEQPPLVTSPEELDARRELEQEDADEVFGGNEEDEERVGGLVDYFENLGISR